MTQTSVDTIIDNGYVVTMNPRREIFARGAVAIDGGKIRGVGRSEDIARDFRAERQIDAAGGVVHPGFIDTHVHLMNAARGAFSDTMELGVSFNINKKWWNNVEDEDEYASALLCGLEMLGNGTTCFLEAGTVHAPDVVADAVNRLGIRAYLGDPFLWDVPLAPGGDKGARAPRGLRRSLDPLGRQLRRNSDRDALVQGCVVVFGLGSATDELALAAKRAADEHGVVYTQHQSFAPADAGADQQRFGRPALVHLHEIGLLGRNCTFSHMNDLDGDEVDCVAASGMSVAWCPSAAMTIATGATIHGSHLEMLRRGVNTSLGSDGPNSSCRYDLNLQGLLTVVSAREKMKIRSAMSLEDVLEMATINGAQAVGAQDRLGSLEVGKHADLVVRTTDLPEAQPGVDPLQHMLYSCGSRSVSQVFVAGKLVWRGGRPTQIEAREVFHLAREAADRMWKKLGLKSEPRWPVIA
jgi:5-methylthioadenosine/S-adenosylhomocysteine deaminase